MCPRTLILDSRTLVPRIRAPRGQPIDSNGQGNRSIWNLLTVGTTLVACIVTGYLLGSFLDRKLGTSPWLVVVGVLLGTAAGFVGLFRMVSRNLK